MIVCDIRNVIELNNKSIQDLKFDDVVCYVFVGGNPGGTEGDVYIFTLTHSELRVYSGNVFYGGLDRENVYALLEGTNGFFGEWRMTKCNDGWQGIPYVMGHYVFVKEFMVESLQKNWKTIDCRYHFERLIRSVYETTKEFEDRLLTSNVIEGKDVLLSIIDMYPDILNDSFRLRAALSDLLPGDALHRNLICAASDVGIPQTIAKIDKELSPRYIQILIQKLAMSYGCREALAEQIIYLWISVIDECEISLAGELSSIRDVSITERKTVIEELIDILKNNPTVWKEPKTIRAMIKDDSRKDSILRNLVCVAVTEHIPHDIYFGDNVDNIYVQSLVNRLISAFGCKENLAEEAVICWRDAIRIVLNRGYEKVGTINVPHFSKNGAINHLQNVFYLNENIYELIGLLYCSLFHFDSEIKKEDVIKIADAGLAYIRMLKPDESLDGKMALLRVQFMGAIFCIVKGDLRSAARFYNEIIANSVLEYDRCLNQRGKKDSEYISLYFMSLTNVFNVCAVSGLNLYYLKKLEEYEKFFSYINPAIFTKEMLQQGYFSIAFPHFEKYSNPVYGNNFDNDIYQARFDYGMYGRLRVWRNNSKDKTMNITIASFAHPYFDNKKNNVRASIVIDCNPFGGIPNNWNDHINSSEDMDYMVYATNKRHTTG